MTPRTLRTTTGQGAALARWIGVGVLVAGAWWLVTVMASRGFGLGVALVTLAAMAAVLVYGTTRPVPLKYLLPALLVTVGLHVWPIVFTAGISFTNYAPGRALSQASAAGEIVTNSIRPVAGGVRYEMSLAVGAGQPPSDGALVMLLVDPAGRALVAGDGRLTELTDGVERAPSGRIAAAAGYDVLTVSEREARRADVERLARMTGEGSGVRAVSLYEAVGGAPTKRYDDDAELIVDRLDGRTYRPVDGRFVAADGSGEVLPPEWLEGVGVNNFTRVIAEEPLRSAFLAALVWNLWFAVLAAGGALVFGALAALLLDDPRLAGRRSYRAALLSPYALPVFVSALAWRGLVGAGLLAETGGARLAVLLAAWWLGIPVMVVVCTQALKAIPTEVNDAARLDGATGVTALIRVRLPLLFPPVAPLLIGMFAVYFNHFSLVYLITGGGPFGRAGGILPGGVEVGATDLLITIAYRIAFDASSPSYGFAAAVSTFALALTALMVAAVFRGIRRLEEETAR